MDKPTPMSLQNHTGLQMSPIHSAQLLEAQRSFRPPSIDTGAADAIRREYVAEADALGSVPAPGTMRGMAKSGAQMLTGMRPQELMDKLGERLAFERTGTRLYEAMIRKCEVADAPGTMTLEQLRHIRDEEAQHAVILVQAIEMLGGDPTAQTPGAVATAVEGMGLVQLIGDPRTTPTQCLHALLIAELADTASWDVLIELAEQSKQTELVARFRQALQNENEHVERVSAAYRAAVLSDAELMTRH